MKKNLLWVIMLLLFYNILFAQEEIMQSDTAKNGVVKFQRFNTSLNPRLTANEKDVLKQTLKMSSNDSLRLETTVVTENYSHKIYQQFYRGFQVLGGTYATHEKDGKIESINGFFQKVGTPDIKPTIIEQTALNKALALIDAKKYGWEDEFTENRYKERMKNSSATLRPKGELLIIFDDSLSHSYRLAYMFHIYAVIPLVNKNVYIDAISGNIIGVENLIQDANVVGTANTLYSKTQSITMDSYSTPVMYRLQETRTTNGKTAQIQTFDMQNGGNYSAAVDFSNSSTNWTTANAGLDVHWGTEKVLDYWSTVRNRNSFDGSGGTLKGYVHANLPMIDPFHYSDNDNAFWDPTMHAMTYGDGTTKFKSVVSLDVIAHEIGHGICQYTANLNNSVSSNNEQSALNEGLSDIWGAVIEDWAAVPNKQTWEIGEDIMKNGKPCLRSLSNPQSLSYPDTYQGKNWSSSNDPHTNCTVFSHWFYLLSQGGSGTNGLNNSYSVTGIGITKAADIVWNAESTGRLQPQSQYADARTAMISAATEIYQCGSNEVAQVTHAWYAVGVGEDYKSPTITGPGFACYGSNATFILNNVPDCATTTSWSVSGPVTIVNQSNNSVTVSPTSSEPFTADLTAKLYQNGNLVYTTVKTLSANMANFNINGPSVILALQSGSYSANVSPNSCSLPSTGVNYEWRINGALVETSPSVSIQSVQGGASTSSAMSTNTGSKNKVVLKGDSMTVNQLITTPINNIELSVTIKNSSGKIFGSASMQVTIYGDYKVISKALSPPAPIAMNVYPNPASGILNIETGEDGNTQSAAKQQTTTDTKPLKTDITREVRLYDGHGKLLLHTKTKDSHVHLNVSHLHNGIYYLHIYSGVSDKPEIHQIMVKH